MLEFREVRFAWPGESEPLFEALSLACQPGQHLGLVGDNGAGKSTLLRLAAGLLIPQQGQVLWRGHSLAELSAGERARRIGVLFQEPEAQLSHSRVVEEVAFGLRLQGVAKPERDQRALAVLSQLGLDACAEAHPLDLDAGRRRMVALAAVIVLEPELLLLDEPCRDFDRHWLARFERWLQQHQGTGGTVISVSHDLDFVARRADGVVHLEQGSILARGTPREVLPHPLLQAPGPLPSPTLWSLEQALKPRSCLD